MSRLLRLTSSLFSTLAIALFTLGSLTMLAGPGYADPPPLEVDCSGCADDRKKGDQCSGPSPCPDGCPKADQCAESCWCTFKGIANCACHPPEEGDPNDP